MARLEARPEPLDIDPARAAVVVVDMQNAFASRGGMLDLAGMDVSGADAAVDATVRVVDAARSAAVPVVYLQMSYAPDYSDGGGPESPNWHKELALRLSRERPDFGGQLLVRGTWDWQIVDRLAPAPGDEVIEKSRYSGFCRTKLDRYLAGAGVRYLFFTGIATNVCVESTARDAYFHEYWPILVEDAMNHAGPDFNRQATLWQFENIFGWLTSSADLAAMLETAERTGRLKRRA